VQNGDGRGSVRRLGITAAATWLLAASCSAGFPDEKLLAGLEANGTPYVARIKNNKVLDHLGVPHLRRPPGRPPAEPRVWFHEMIHAAGSWSRPRRVVPAVLEQPDDLLLRHFWLLASINANTLDGEALQSARDLSLESGIRLAKRIKGLCNELRVCAARSRRRSLVGRTRSVEGDRALWRFHPGRLVPRRIGAPRPSRPERHDRSITVDEGSFRMVGVVIRVKVMAVTCIDNKGPPWRGGTRTNNTEPWWWRVPRIMAPWPAGG
jgi:hypothetical protein